MIQLPALALAATAAVLLPFAANAKGGADGKNDPRTSRSRTSEVHCKLGTQWVPERQACVAPREGRAAARLPGGAPVLENTAIGELANAAAPEEGLRPQGPAVPRVPPFPGSLGLG